MTKHDYRGSELDDSDRRAKDERLQKGGDSTFTFRLDEKLKADFIELCQKERYSAASALKRYMARCVAKGFITHDFSKLKIVNSKTKFRR